MDSTESREPSYYEIALTNRQVLVAFVVLLVCVLAAFFAGVWIGRGSAPESAARQANPADRTASAAPSDTGELTFFHDQGTAPASRAATGGATAPASAPAASAKSAASPPASGSATAAARPPGVLVQVNPPEAGAGASGGESTGAEPRPGEATAAPKPAAAAGPAAAVAGTASASAPGAPAAAAAAKSLFVQVYSSTNGARATQIEKQLKRGGFATQLASFDVKGAKHYRVRVGPFATKEKADAAAAKLKKGYKLDTWVTDTP